MLKVINDLSSLKGILLTFFELLFGFGSFLLLMLGLVFCVFPGSLWPFEDLYLQLFEEPLVDERVPNLVGLGLNMNNVSGYCEHPVPNHSTVLTEMLLNFLIS